ncbi:hypothetical protein FG463_002171 [Yersinia enterocolitica]|nr:hypothetical protein [Yersinia enterocolitica]EKN4877111.1 hypothetical protein [Yersinia enterocolitica]ELW8170039.1 hypothetical protein [Yersinia enterocolitica]
MNKNLYRIVFNKARGMLIVVADIAASVANPSGITCEGCGFINANRATLTTGQAQLNNGQLTGYDVDRGEIVIQGKHD